MQARVVIPEILSEAERFHTDKFRPEPQAYKNMFNKSETHVKVCFHIKLEHIKSLFDAKKTLPTTFH